MFCQFLRKSDGVVDPLPESVCEELDAMMLDLVSNSPKWEPAMNQGKPVAQVITIPVVFQMR